MERPLDALLGDFRIQQGVRVVEAEHVAEALLQGERVAGGGVAGGAPS